MISTLASVSSVFVTIFYIVLAILVLMLMITIHELGHYLIGKKLGFKINEFAIGFGKAIYQKTLKSGEIFSIRLIPLGGYCAFAGEDDNDMSEGSFNSQKPWKRILTLFGGVLFNFISAIIFAFILLLCFGYDIPKVTSTNEHLTSDIRAGDIIREIDGKSIDYVQNNNFNTMLSEYDIGENMTLTIQRNGEMVNIVTQIYSYEDTAGNEVKTLGYYTTACPYTFGEAIAKCVPLACTFAWKVLEFLFLLVTGSVALADVGGPITTVSTIVEYSQINIANLFIFLPFIAANLAIFNILPFPALDGARIIFTTIEWIRGKPINRKVEGYIHFGGLLILLAFVVFVDLYHLFI